MATGREIKDIYDMMQKICDETSKLISVINDMLINEEFEAVGDGSVMLNKSKHYLYSKYWLPYFLQRVYIRKPNVMKGVGINIMFDGSIDGLENKIPFLTCGFVDFSEGQLTKGNALYKAGWTEHEEVEKSFNGNLCTTTYTDGVTATTYFLPLEVVSSQENVNMYVIRPLICMYKGEYIEADNMVNKVAIGLKDIIGQVKS
ncbi:hypothetical protein [Bacillus sp. JJ722]|uniref:hypothetical protein n=1 Tax=Bacillus sp. JJ722 TaxID=3122973 RepID=UPI00300017F0